MYKLNAATNSVPSKTGLGIVLKVMAGDIISIYGKSYHKRPSGGNYTSGVNTLSVLDILSAFTGSAAVSGKSVTPSQITAQSGFPTTVGGLTNGGPSQTTTTLKAGINWILFDEQFHFSEGGYDPVGSDASGAGILKIHNLSTIPAITAKKNGYIYVYCSNESQYDVFFDNLQLVHKPGPITEETHYYPFGLTMAGISSKAVNFGKDNKYNFNGIEQNNDLNINTYDAFYRNLDPQIGRFWQPDPVTSYFESVYIAMQNNPVSKTDWLGDYFTWANENVEATYKTMREDNNKRMSGYLSELLSIVNSGEKGMDKEINRLATLINSHAELNSQWDEMESSDVEFYVSSDKPSGTANGDTHYNADKKRIDIRLGKGDKNVPLMVHEIRHGMDF